MKISNKLQFFTIVAQNYLAHAFVLGDSVIQHHPDADFSVFLIDDVKKQWQSTIHERGFRVIYPDDIPLRDYRKFVFKYNITEASTGVKPFIFRWFFENGKERVIYLDPDIRCFRTLEEVTHALDGASIVLTPHSCSPKPDGATSEIDFLSHGAFNLGFIALRRGGCAWDFVNWWSQRLFDSCLSQPESGLFVDQKWVDLAPAFFENVSILRNPSYNIAYWNLHERTLEERDAVLFEVDSGQPVAFIHFSGFDLSDRQSVSKYKLRNPLDKRFGQDTTTFEDRPDLKKPFCEYRDLLLAAGAGEFSNISYAYASYDNGERIPQLARSIYGASAAWQQSELDPFLTDDRSFWQRCQEIGIRCGDRAYYKHPPTELNRRYGRYMRLIELALKLCLRFLGPDRYVDLAKYLRHQLLLTNQGFLLAETSRNEVDQRAIASELSSGPEWELSKLAAAPTARRTHRKVR